MSLKKFLFSGLFLIAFLPLQAFATGETVIFEEKDSLIPEEMDWTERFILNEQKELRIDLETLRREIMTEIQARELAAVDRALSYSANTLNFFFIFLSIVIMGLGVIGWRSITDAKNTIKVHMEKEISKTLTKFQNKIKRLEEQQKVNILWRQFYSSDSNTEQVDILKKIEQLTPNSTTLKIERSNIYLAMGSFEQVVETATEILKETYDSPQALFNRSYAYASLGEAKKAEEDLIHLLNISPDYESNISEDPVFKKIYTKIKKKK